jgi:3-oxoacid CoA-transferase subunit B
MVAKIDKPRMDRETIAMRVAKELPDGAYVNLGIGIPTLVSNFLPEGRTVVYQSESGVLGYGALADEGEEDIDLINAGGQFLKPVPGMTYFSSAEAFMMIRGGHIDVTVLGALQVSEKGDLANWMLPSRGIGNVGGAMDLAAGAKRVIVAMEHNDKSGESKVVRECTFPLTGKGCVSLIVTDIAVIAVTPQGLVLREVAPGWKAEDVQSATDARLIIPQGGVTAVEL